ncbi:hypothetical protein [Flavobacterium psychrotrophum]|uniref:hypothetical protein n=1 Tax=Flavobacterium psychrotrophum TaxID=2294119 RepID=UPI000E318CF7|nr:hypothetical protein [Flavobacterium psychrotrophum]
MSTKNTATQLQNSEKNQPAATATEQAKNDHKAQENVLKAILMPVNASQRLKSLENMQLLGKRYAFLQAKQDELNTFLISNDDTKEKLTLKNASGFEFTISNTNVIAEVVERIAAHLEQKRQSTEQEILNFVI